MTKVIIFPEEDLDKYFKRTLAKLADKWKMEHPQYRWKSGTQLSPDTEFSSKVENPDPRRVY